MSNKNLDTNTVLIGCLSPILLLAVVGIVATSAIDRNDPEFGVKFIGMLAACVVLGDLLGGVSLMVPGSRSALFRLSKIFCGNNEPEEKPLILNW